MLVFKTEIHQNIGVIMMSDLNPLILVSSASENILNLFKIETLRKFLEFSETQHKQLEDLAINRPN